MTAKQIQRVAGATLSKLDERDVILDHLIVELSGSASIKAGSSNTPVVMRNPVFVFDQGDSSICVACTAATIINLQYGITDANPYFPYNCREDQQKDVGMATKNLLVVGYRYGIPTFEAYQSHQINTSADGRPHLQVTSQTLQTALKYRFTGYGRVFSLQTAMDLMLLNRDGKYKNAFGGLFLVVPMHNDSKRFWVKNTLETVLLMRKLGYHCVTIIDVDAVKRVFKVQNSWSKEWEDGGCTYFSFDDWGYVAECWFATNSSEIAALLKERVSKLNTFRNHSNGQLNANDRYNKTYNMSPLNSQLQYTSALSMTQK
jgi:hypothetical protein